MELLQQRCLQEWQGLKVCPLMCSSQTAQSDTYDCWFAQPERLQICILALQQPLTATWLWMISWLCRLLWRDDILEVPHFLQGSFNLH